jgi:hypothetical protein
LQKLEKKKKIDFFDFFDFSYSFNLKLRIFHLEERLSAGTGTGVGGGNRRFYGSFDRKIGVSESENGVFERFWGFIEGVLWLIFLRF